MISIFLLIKKFLAFLNSNESVENISFSLTLALSFALIPFTPLIHLTLLILLISFNGNLFIFLFITPLLKLVAPHIYYEIHLLGNVILSNGSLTPIFEKLADIPLLNFLNWNNTVTLGSYIYCIIGSIPVYYFYKMSINQYRQKLLPKLKQSKNFHVFKVPNWITFFRK